MALLNPYIHFTGNAREAMEFYRSVFGGELTMSSFGDFQMPGVGPDEADKIMHGQLVTSAGLTLMGADTPSTMGEVTPGSQITISLSGSEADGLRAYWDGLAEGGTITLPLNVAPWGDSYGQLVDRFGIEWMVNIAGPAQT
ncbi:MAG: VOC family protein [Propionibacteriaceae bacterium]|nr:VOC family protein [Propionibacteriaceae bacterium]